MPLIELVSEEDDEEYEVGENVGGSHPAVEEEEEFEEEEEIRSAQLLSAQQKVPRSPLSSPPIKAPPRSRKPSAIPSPVQGCTQGAMGPRYDLPGDGNYLYLQPLHVNGLPGKESGFSMLNNRKTGNKQEVQEQCEARTCDASKGFDDLSVIKEALEGNDKIIRILKEWPNKDWKMYAPTVSGNNLKYPTILRKKSKSGETEVCEFGRYLLVKVNPKTFSVTYYTCLSCRN